MAEYWYLVSVLVASLIALVLAFRGIPEYIDKFIEKGFTAKDMYKTTKWIIADKGGILIVYYAGIFSDFYKN